MGARPRRDTRPPAHAAAAAGPPRPPTAPPPRPTAFFEPPPPPPPAPAAPLRWQLGAMAYLAQRYDLTRVPMVGASGGAICAALARCGVRAEDAAAAATRLSREHRIWDKPLGLAGAYGRLIEAWLDDLLPADAAERCRGALSVVVTQLPSCRQVAISDFRDKKDLIDVIMASAHVPLLLDAKLVRSCRGVAACDGSFPDFFTGARRRRGRGQGRWTCRGALGGPAPPAGS
jgi:hypothetical protein